jgi:hypothetical protein
MCLFDEECRRFLTINPDESVQIQGGELDNRLDILGNPLVGGRLTNEDAGATSCGKDIRDKLRDYISSRGFICPKSNWYRDNNRVLED